MPSWLDTPQLQYRLLFADATRRRSYAESRWVAPPGELLEAALRRQLMGDGNAPANGGCMLRVDLDELLQVFHTPQRSDGLIELQVSLVAPRGGCGAGAQQVRGRHARGNGRRARRRGCGVGGGNGCRATPAGLAERP